MRCDRAIALLHGSSCYPGVRAAVGHERASWSVPVVTVVDETLKVLLGGSESAAAFHAELRASARSLAELIAGAFDEGWLV